MPRPPVKKTKVLAQAAAYGSKLGDMKAEAHFKKLKVGQDRTLREHIGKLVDRLSVENIVQVPLFLFTSYTIFNVLKSSTDFVEKAVKKGEKIKDITVGKLPAPVQTLWNVFTWSQRAMGIPIDFLFPITGAVSPDKVLTEMELEELKTFNQTDMLIVGVSLVIAYLIIFKPEVIAQVFGQGIGGIATLGKLLIGATL